MNWNGEKLNILCGKRGVSASGLSELLGVSRPTVYKWLSGSDPRGTQLLQICELLEADPWELYDGKPAEDASPAVAEGKLFKRSGIKLVYTLLTDPRLHEDDVPNLLNIPIRQLAIKAGVSTGSVSELLNEMKERGFLLTDGHLKKMVHCKQLFEKWLHGYMDYRLKVKKLCFKAETVRWWEGRYPAQESFLWGGEPAGSILTDGYLRPEKLTLYTDKPLYDLIVDGNLHQVSSGGNVEIVEPFLKTEGVQGCVHPLLVYADLICSSDERNLETARRVHDRYLRDLIEAN
jgi:hypothetical protein